MKTTIEFKENAQGNKSETTKPMSVKPNKPRGCQWMQGVMNPETSSWQRCEYEAVAEVFRNGLSVGRVCEAHERTAKLFGWQTQRPIRNGIPNV